MFSSSFQIGPKYKFLVPDLLLVVIYTWKWANTKKNCNFKDPHSFSSINKINVSFEIFYYCTIFPFLAHSVPSTILNTEFVSLLYKPKHSCSYSCILISQFSFLRYVKEYFSHISAQSSLSIFPQKYLCVCEDTYFILQNKYIFGFTEIVLDQIYLEMIASLV